MCELMNVMTEEQADDLIDIFEKEEDRESILARQGLPLEVHRVTPHEGDEALAARLRPPDERGDEAQRVTL
jgi:hypothetical protein